MGLQNESVPESNQQDSTPEIRYRLPFKRNFHIAKRMRLEKVEHLIETYPDQYPTPKYLSFIKKFLEDGWNVKIYEVRVSKYIFVYTETKIYKIRFSNHKPLYQKEIENDCDYYVGISHKATHTTDQIINLIIKRNEN